MDTRSLTAHSSPTVPASSPQQTGISSKSPPAQFFNIPTDLDIGLCFCKSSVFQHFLFNYQLYLLLL